MVNRLFIVLVFLFSFQDISAQMTTKPGSLQDVLDQYYALGNALSDSDLKTALVKAKKLEAEITDNNFIALFGTSFISLKSASDIALLRQVHYQFSQKLRQTLPFSETLEDVVFVIHCPTVFNDSGAFWLSEEKSIHNPYLDAENTSCGKLIETIKPMVK